MPTLDQDRAFAEELHSAADRMAIRILAMERVAPDVPVVLMPSEAALMADLLRLAGRYVQEHTP